MRAEFIETKTRRYRPRRSLGDRVQEALLALAKVQAQLLTHEEQSWASITFTGTRHDIMLDFNGSKAVAAGEEFVAALPDHEFTIPGQLVADATINSVKHTMLPAPRMIVTLTLLLLEDV